MLIKNTDVREQRAFIGTYMLQLLEISVGVLVIISEYLQYLSYRFQEFPSSSGLFLALPPKAFLCVYVHFYSYSLAFQEARARPRVLLSAPQRSLAHLRDTLNPPKPSFTVKGPLALPGAPQSPPGALQSPPGALQSLRSAFLPSPSASLSLPSAPRSLPTLPIRFQRS